MDVKVVFLIVCLSALAITSTEAGIPNCCMRARKYVKRGILKRVYKWEMQEINDRCDIKALVLYVKGWGKPICADPSVKEELNTGQRMMLKKKRSS